MSEKNSDGLTDEEIAWLDAQEPLPSLSDGYVHPITGEVIWEAGPDTPQARRMRAESEAWFEEQREIRRREEPEEELKGNESEAEIRAREAERLRRLNQAEAEIRRRLDNQ